MIAPFSRLAIGVLRWYRRWLSPDHGYRRVFFPHGCCRFYPTCSVYAERAIVAHGLTKGLRLTISRLSRCHPWHPGGIDEPVSTH